MHTRHRRSLDVLVPVGGLVVTLLFFHGILWMRRPFEWLMLMLLIVGAVSGFLVRRDWLRNAYVVVASVAGVLFLVEIAEKVFDITGRLENRIRIERVGAEPYAWTLGSTAEYLAAKDRAIADGIYGDSFPADDFAGGFPASPPHGGLWRKTTHSGGKILIMEALKPRFLFGSPLGFRMNPDNVIRRYGRDEASGRTVFDGLAVIDGTGTRHTRGRPDSESVHLFVGCSFTYGYGLSDHETLAQQFSESLGFEERVINLGVNGYGPQHVLREFELNLRPGDLQVRKPVRTVIFSLIDDHRERVEQSFYAGTPHYALKDGKIVFTGETGGSYLCDRLVALVARSRMAAWMARILERSFIRGDDWDLALAVLGRIHELCRERYDVGLTVVYWGDFSNVPERLKAVGMNVVTVEEAFGKNWRKDAVKYLLYDGHPSAYANRSLARGLAERLTKTEGSPMPDLAGLASH